MFGTRLIRRIVVVTCCLALTGLGAVAGGGAAQAAVSDADLAYHWAPVHYQDTASFKYIADYLSAFDYDANWAGLDNWDHLDAYSSQLLGNVYFSVVENDTTWYLVYAFFHPRDWSEIPGPWTHENDMEGLLEVVAKDGSTYGVLRAAVTIAHTDFYSYLAPGSPYSSGQETVDGTLIMQSFGGSQHPATFQEAKGHGCYRWNGSGFPGGDGVVYYPSGTAERPSSGNDRSVGYRLVDIFDAGELWARRYNSETYYSFGTFRGDNGEDNAANAPWGWDDHDDGAIARGDMAIDPAKLVRTYFAGAGPQSSTYLRNTYQGG